MGEDLRTWPRPPAGSVVTQLHRGCARSTTRDPAPSRSAVLDRLYREGATQGELAAGQHVRSSRCGHLASLTSWPPRAAAPTPATGGDPSSACPAGTDTVRGILEHCDEWLAQALLDELSPAELEAVTRALPLLQRAAQH